MNINFYSSALRMLLRSVFILSSVACVAVSLSACDDDDDPVTADDFDATTIADQPVATIDSVRYYIVKIKLSDYSLQYDYTLVDDGYLLAEIDGVDTDEHFDVESYTPLSLIGSLADTTYDYMSDFIFTDAGYIKSYNQRIGEYQACEFTDASYSGTHLKSVAYNWYDTRYEACLQQGTISLTWDGDTLTQIVDKYTFDLTDYGDESGSETITYTFDSYLSDCCASGDYLGRQHVPASYYGALSQSPFLYLGWFGDGSALLPETVTYTTSDGTTSTDQISVFDTNSYGLIYQTEAYHGYEYTAFDTPSGTMTFTYIYSLVQ